MKAVVDIKNMVCPRCVAAVRGIFNDLNVPVESVRLGQVVLLEPLAPNDSARLDELLKQNGFERIDDQRAQLLESIKTSVIELIHHQDHFALNVNWSHYLSEKLNNDYSYLSSLFSSVSGITLEQYIIKQKIEKVKEFLIYNQLSLKEIAFKLSYSSVAHLSSQFKKISGMTPSAFKKSYDLDARQSLDSIN